MPHDARAVANLLLDFAERDKIAITHLSLQKILFFVHAWHLGKYNSPLIGQKFEAWKYGPVNRVVYDQLKMWKEQPISTRLKKVDVETGDWVEANSFFVDHEWIFVRNIFSYYSRFHAGRLVDLTHIKDGPWEKVWSNSVDRPVLGMLIPDEEIRLWILRGGGLEGTEAN